MAIKIKKFILNSLKICQWVIVALKNYKQPIPVYPKSTKSGLKVHLGSGDVNMQGWINIDAREFYHTHLVSEGFDLSEFADNTIEELYLCHVLEHFSFLEAEQLLINLRKKLAEGGISGYQYQILMRLLESMVRIIIIY